MAVVLEPVDQLKVPPEQPLTVNPVDKPAQIDTELLVKTGVAGCNSTVTDVADDVQPLLLRTVTAYVPELTPVNVGSELYTDPFTL